MFPNGSYFTEAGNTGFANLIHLKPNLTFARAPNLELTLAAGSLWRMTTQDAVHAQPSIPLPRTAGRGGRYTGTYGQIQAAWQPTPNLRLSAEAVHFEIGDALRAAGARCSRYLASQLLVTW